jgi:hypothetical protein
VHVVIRGVASCPAARNTCVCAKLLVYALIRAVQSLDLMHACRSTAAPPVPSYHMDMVTANSRMDTRRAGAPPLPASTTPQRHG